MFDNFQLAVIVGSGTRTRLLRVPLLQELQNTLAVSWKEQYDAFMGDIEEVDFDAGYNTEGNERFRLSDFELPEWLSNKSSETSPQLDSISEQEGSMATIKAVVAFVKHDDEELILFQNFTRSHVIRPGRFLFLQNDTYASSCHPGLALSNKLSAVYSAQDQKLLFDQFRTANTFLPLSQFYREATEQDVREVLGHELLAPEDVDAIAGYSNKQWFAKRFAMLRDSGILEGYDAEQIQSHSNDYDVDVQVDDGKIVLPADELALKRLLQYLNEELFLGAITEKLYETNSKRETDQ